MGSSNSWGLLGTAGGHVENVGYRPEWAGVFERERVAILDGCKPWVMEVHHVGSTSVPGMAAKPILDIMPVVASPNDGEKAVGSMTALGYRYRGENELPGRFYFDKIVDGRTVAHIHMLPAGHPDARKHLVLRDHLRSHPETARDYERLKRELALKYRDDRLAYTESKAEFINRVIDTAMDDFGDSCDPISPGLRRKS